MPAIKISKLSRRNVAYDESYEWLQDRLNTWIPMYDATWDKDGKLYGFTLYYKETVLTLFNVDNKDLIEYELQGLWFDTPTKDSVDEDSDEPPRLTEGMFVQHFKRELVEPDSEKYLYKILDFVTHSETKERMVVYKALYRDDEMGVNFGTYVRPYDMFMSKVDKDKYPDIKQTYRFEEVKM